MRQKATLQWLLDPETIILPMLELAPENRRRIRRNQFVTLQHELWEKLIADQFVNLIPAEIAAEFVFVIVVAPYPQLFAVGCALSVFVQHDEQRCAPGLPGPADVAPKVKFWFEIATSDKMIARRLNLDSLRQREPGLFDPIRNRLAAAEEEETNEKWKGRSHGPV